MHAPGSSSAHLALDGEGDTAGGEQAMGPDPAEDIHRKPAILNSEPPEQWVRPPEWHGENQVGTLPPGEREVGAGREGRPEARGEGATQCQSGAVHKRNFNWNGTEKFFPLFSHFLFQPVYKPIR